VRRQAALGCTKLEEPFGIAHVLFQRGEYGYIFVNIESIKSMDPTVVMQCRIGSEEQFECF